MSALYKWDDFVLDAENFRLERDGSPMPLEPKALNVLLFLVSRPARLVTKQELFDAVWPDTAVTDHALTRVIAQLRRALGDEARDARYIETVPTRGYRWIRPLKDINPDAAPPPAAGAAVPVTMAARAPQPAPRLAFRSVAVGLLLMVAALVVYSQRGETTPSIAEPSPMSMTGTPQGVRWPVQLTTRNGLDLHPALSPLGDALAYVSDETGAFEIYVRASSGAASDTALTSDGRQNVQPAWSPDGRFIAYHSLARGGIWLIPARGGLPRQLATEGSHPAWSPDGTAIAFQSDEHPEVTPSGWGALTGSTLWRVDVSGAPPAPLTVRGQPAGGHASPAWSPDGRFVAFTVFDGGPQNGVWVLDVGAGATRPLVRGSGLYELAFAPDGSAIFAAGGEALIKRFPFDQRTGTVNGPDVAIAVGGVPGVRGLSIAADGRTLAFSGLSLSSHIWALPLRADGTAASEARAITSDTSRRNSLPLVSPDGARIAYLSTRGGAAAPDLWVMNVDGSDARPVIVNDDSGAGFGWKRWMPDSRRLAYLVDRSGQPQVWAVEIDTRRAGMLFPYSAAREAAAAAGLRGWFGEMQLSPSVTQVAFSLVTPPDGHKRLFVSNAEAARARAVTNGVESVGYPVWSPDERQIALEVKRGSSTQLAVVDAATGTLRRLTDARGHAWVRSWSPDGRQLAAAVLRDGRWSLRSIDVPTGRETILMAPQPPHVYLRYPDWSPRGDVMLFERGELRGNIWTMAIQ